MTPVLPDEELASMLEMFDATNGGGFQQCESQRSVDSGLGGDFSITSTNVLSNNSHSALGYSSPESQSPPSFHQVIKESFKLCYIVR